MAFGIDSRLVLLGLLFGALSFVLPSLFTLRTTKQDATWLAAKRLQDRIPIVENHDPLSAISGDSLVSIKPPRVRKNEEESIFGKDAVVLTSPKKEAQKKEHRMPLYFITSSEVPSSEIKAAWKKIGDEIASLNGLNGIIALHLADTNPGQEVVQVAMDSAATGGNYETVLGSNTLQSEDVYYTLQKCNIPSTTIKSTRASSSKSIEDILSYDKKHPHLPTVHAFISPHTNPKSLLRMGECLSQYRSQGIVLIGTSGNSPSLQTPPAQDLTNLITHFTNNARSTLALSLDWSQSPSLPLLVLIGAAKEEEGELLFPSRTKARGAAVDYRFGHELGDSDQHLGL
ncbi:hypothetical protein BT69DRAFT_1354764 [Atractiella rhizophila]|nr:hypothetical protein BT69DRAFT_1354764 [Atractiella rhizophila]